MVEHLPFKQRVAGSIPASLTKSPWYSRAFSWGSLSEGVQREVEFEGGLAKTSGAATIRSISTSRANVSPNFRMVPNR